jgi:hypothetical protein
MLRYRERIRRGQSLPEYALLIALIAAAVVLSLSLLGVRLRDVTCVIIGGLGGDDRCGVYLHETFDDLSGWFVERGNWSTEDGHLLGGPNEGRIFREIGLDDYTITLNGANLRDGGGYGVWFRTDPGPPLNGYTFQYDPGYGGEFIFRKWVDGHELSPFARVKPAALGLDPFDWHDTDHQVQVVVRGDTFQAVVDGQVVLEGQDDTHQGGHIGLRTWHYQTDLAVDDLTVTP